MMNESKLEVLAFTIAEQHYGIRIDSVREIRGYEKVTEIANAPSQLRGIINLRGTIVPIIDMRVHLGISDPIFNAQTVVVILNIGIKLIGIVVDTVSEVFILDEENIKPAPDFGNKVDTAFINGVASIETVTMLLLDINSLIASIFIDNNFEQK